MPLVRRALLPEELGEIADIALRFGLTDCAWKFIDAAYAAADGLQFEGIETLVTLLRQAVLDGRADLSVREKTLLRLHDG